MYVADTFNNLVRQINAQTGLISVVAGISPDRWDNIAFQGSTPDNSALDYPANVVAGVALDNSNNLYVVDTGNSLIHVVNLSSGVLTFTQSGTESVTLSNLENTTIDISGLSLSGPGASDFSVSSDNCNSTLTIGANCNVSISFLPSVSTLRQAELLIIDNTTNSPHSVELTGTGVPGASQVAANPPTSTSSTNPPQGGTQSPNPVVAPTDPGGSSSSSPDPPVSGVGVGGPPTTTPVGNNSGLTFSPNSRADYDGDGKIDFAVWRPSTATFYVVPSSNPTGPGIVQQLGWSSDIPMSGGYDGDGKADFAVWRPSDATFYVVPSSNPTGPGIVQQLGWSSDIP